MTTAIRIGNDKGTTEGLKDLLVSLFESGHKNHVDQRTIVAAIEVVGQVMSGMNQSVNVSGCEFRLGCDTCKDDAEVVNGAEE